MLTRRNFTFGLFWYFVYAVLIFGSSALQRPHHDAKKFSRTTLPWSSFGSYGLPSTVVSFSAGRGRLTRLFNAAALRASRRRVSSSVTPGTNGFPAAALSPARRHPPLEGRG